MSIIEYIDNIKENVLLLYPQILGNYNIAALLISLPELSNHYIYVITDNSNNINKFLTQPLPPEYYIKYNNNLDNIRNESNYILIIDDIENYYKYELDKHLNKYNKLKIICLTKGDIKINDNWNILTLYLNDESPLLKHHLTIYKDINQEYRNIINSSLKNIDDTHIIITNNQDINNINSIIKTYDIKNLHGSNIDNLSNNILNINNVHIFNINLKTYKEIIINLYKKHNIDNKIDIFNIIFYINEDNKDVVNGYDEISNYIHDYIENYIKLYKKARKIKYNLSKGIYVE